MHVITRIRPWLTATAAGCCAILLPGLALAAPAAPARIAPRMTAPGCETPGLVIWLNTNGNGTAGSVYYNLELTNLSGHTCALDGFPFINAVGPTGGLLGSRAAFTHKTPASVTLRQGQTAQAVLQLVDVGNFPASACKPVTAAGLRVFPPNQTRAKAVPFPFGACSASGPVFLRAGPVTK